MMLEHLRSRVVYTVIRKVEKVPLSCCGHAMVENNNDDDYFSGKVSGIVAETNCSVVILLAEVVLRVDKGKVVYTRRCTGDVSLAVVVICTVVEVMVTL